MMLKKNRGMSLLEVVVAITLLGVIFPMLFGAFQAHTNLANQLSVQGNMRDVAKDIKSFVKISPYETIFNMAKNNEILTIKEVAEDDVLTRHFVKYSESDKIEKSDLLVGIEFANSKIFHSDIIDVSDTTAIPLRCKIYHIKNKKSNLRMAELLKSSDMEHSTFLVKNR